MDGYDELDLMMTYVLVLGGTLGWALVGSVGLAVAGLLIGEIHPLAELLVFAPAIIAIGLGYLVAGVVSVLLLAAGALELCDRTLAAAGRS